MNKRFKADLCNDISTGQITYNKSSLVKKSFRYSDIIAKIAPYAQVADRNLQVQQLFVDFFEKLDDVQGTIQNRRMPPTLTQSGRFQERPRKSVVLGGKPKEKGVHCCSHCHQPGHYKTNYPSLKNKK